MMVSVVFIIAFWGRLLYAVIQSCRVGNFVHMSNLNLLKHPGKESHE